VKDRIVEYIAVLSLKRDLKGPILCFVGPPGTGKTSLGRSIARALGREFSRVSLGGVRDEAEIRGHRRTYVGALPGRIIQNLRRAGTRNPVFVLDEVDKVGADFRGDPSSALLEVLDPEQNATFSDHYLEVPFDLSQVLFIATANLMDPVPPALRDRMEVIELPGYTAEDKLEIAKRFLVPRQLEQNGVADAGVELPDETLRVVIGSYTREAGVRNLEREIGAIARKLARRVAEEGEKSMRVCARRSRGLLGPVKVEPEVAERTGQPGVAVGLAWTPAGGDILFVESTRMPGKGELKLTGSLGEVMRESAEAARSWLRGHAAEYGSTRVVPHRGSAPARARRARCPRTVPSAGRRDGELADSLMTGRLGRPDVAMTGEITLRGRVLPVGGIKEKVLAAKRGGIGRVVLPARNRKDVEEVEAGLLEGSTSSTWGRSMKRSNTRCRRATSSARRAAGRRAGRAASRAASTTAWSTISRRSASASADLERSNEALGGERLKLIDEMEDLRVNKEQLTADVAKLEKTRDLLTTQPAGERGEGGRALEALDRVRGLVKDLETGGLARARSRSHSCARACA
jgi:ATP-dependent Lon protease